jgi:uncharacterized protein (UPF0210 family)
VHPGQLQQLIANFFNWYEHIANAKPGPLVQDYARLKVTTGALALTPYLPGAATEGLGTSSCIDSSGRPSPAASDLAFVQARNRLFHCQEHT